MVKFMNWDESSEEVKQGFIDDLPNIDEKYIIEFWNNYVYYDNNHLSVYEVGFELDFIVSKEDKAKAIKKAPKNWEDYTYISLTGEVFDSIWDYSEWKKYTEENDLMECAKFIFESRINSDDFLNLMKIREKIYDDIVSYWEDAEPIFKKINKRLEKNNVFNDNLYIMSLDDVEEIMNDLSDKLGIDEIHLLRNLIRVAEISVLKKNCDTATVNKYIKDATKQITDQWKNEMYGIEE